MPRIGPQGVKTSNYCNQWAVLKDMACQKISLVKAAAEIPMETVRAVTAEWLERLKACVEVEDSHFE